MKLCEKCGKLWQDACTCNSRLHCNRCSLSEETISPPSYIFHMYGECRHLTDDVDNYVRHTSSTGTHGYIRHRCAWSNTVSLPDSPIATLGQGPLACSCDAPSLLQLHKRTHRAFNWLQCTPIGGVIWRSGKHRIGPCRRQLKAVWASIPIG